MAPTATKKKRRTQKERSETTTGELLDAARRLFAADGYQATSLDDIAAAADVTKGAVYHHFEEGKVELFRAVFEREQRQLAELSGRAYSRKRDPWQGFYEGCRAYFEASLDPGVQRITLLDAPGVLGWETMREIQGEHSLAQVKAGLELAIESGRIQPRPVEPLAHMLQGALCESAMMVARADDPRRETSRVLRELRILLAAVETA